VIDYTSWKTGKVDAVNRFDSSRRMEKNLISFPQASSGMILGRQKKKENFLRWSTTQKMILFRTEPCEKLLPSFYRASRPDFSMSIFRSDVTIVND